jgi:hypothetical protein
MHGAQVVLDQSAGRYSGKFVLAKLDEPFHLPRFYTVGYSILLQVFGSTLDAPFARIHSSSKPVDRSYRM